MTRAEAEIEINRHLDHILESLSKPTPEMKAAISLDFVECASHERRSSETASKTGEKASRKTPDYDAACQRALKSLGFMLSAEGRREGR